jgi:hypothetical protein
MHTDSAKHVQKTKHENNFFAWQLGADCCFDPIQNVPYSGICTKCTNVPGVFAVKCTCKLGLIITVILFIIERVGRLPYCILANYCTAWVINTTNPMQYTQ